MKAAGDFLVNSNYYSRIATKILHPVFREDRIVLSEICNTLKKKLLECGNVNL